MFYGGPHDASFSSTVAALQAHSTCVQHAQIYLTCPAFGVLKRAHTPFRQGAVAGRTSIVRRTTGPSAADTGAARARRLYAHISHPREQGRDVRTGRVTAMSRPTACKPSAVGLHHTLGLWRCVGHVMHSERKQGWAATDDIGRGRERASARCLV
jgi:hypothetical protein